MSKGKMGLVAAVCLLVSASAFAQQTAIPTANNISTVVPRLIKFSGTLLDERGSAMKGPMGVTFALYTEQSGGAALWMETQNVDPDSNSNYTALLGAASAKGVPQELFVSGDARWLGVQVEGRAESSAEDVLNSTHTRGKKHRRQAAASQSQCERLDHGTVLK